MPGRGVSRVPVMADPTAIFLDTQVFEAASFNFKTTVLASLEEQVQKGTIRLVLTDITVREVKARIEKTVLSQLELLKKFRREARVLRSSTLPEVKAALEFDEKNLIAHLQQQFDDLLARANAEIVDTSIYRPTTTAAPAACPFAATLVPRSVTHGSNTMRVDRTVAAFRLAKRRSLIATG